MTNTYNTNPQYRKHKYISEFVNTDILENKLFTSSQLDCIIPSTSIPGGPS